MKEKTKHRGPSAQLVVGFVIVALGVVFLLQTLGLADFSNLTVWIPSLIVLLGVWILIASRFTNWGGALILIVFGSIAQLAALDIISWSNVWRLWPLALVIVGLVIIIDRARGQDGSNTNGNEYLKLFAMFSGNSQRSTAQSFEGGDLTAVFGGVELDITDVQVAEPPAIIHVFAMFGGMEIKASPDTLIQTHITPIFGGFEDKRRQRKALPGESAEIIIRGTALFGGIEIK